MNILPSLQILFLFFINKLTLIHFATSKLLLIGIFSAPNNFLERFVIRRTWVKLIRHEPHLDYKFIIGKSMCPVSPKLRRSPYDCKKLSGYKGGASFHSATNNLTRQDPLSRKFYATGFGFRADRDIAITHLGLSNCLGDRLTAPVQIKVVDAYDNKEVASVTIHRTVGENLVKAVRPISFPEMSEGIIYVNFFDPAAKQFCNCSNGGWNEEGLISFTSLFADGRSVIFDNHQSSCVYMQYIATEATVDNEKYEATWGSELREIYEDLEKEQETFRDILLVNVTDFYQNLPKKLISFIQSVNNEDYEFVLKTDDDSFLDVSRIASELKNVQRGQLWWWSTFRQYYSVPLAGKWRETGYISATYPPFPCGGGYVLSRPTVEYLNSISEHLALFQGEDVSIGIWLAAVKIQRHKPTHSNMPGYRNVMMGICEKTCEWVCDKKSMLGVCNKAQLSVDKLFKTWYKYLKMGFIT